MKSKVNELVEGVTKIENGTISLTELEITVDVARDLYEKLLIIRHKVYEQSILEKPSYDFSLMDEVEDSSDIISETPSNGEENTVIEMELSEPETETLSSNTVYFSENQAPIEESLFDSEPSVLDIHSDLIENESEFVSPEVNSEINTTDSVEHSEEEEIVVEQLVEDTIVNEYSFENPADLIAENNSSQTPSDWLVKLKAMEDQASADFAMSKLDTLIGSFGLNERLQFINELFDGSSEAFSEAVKLLDVRTGMDSAREKIAEFAEANNWNDADSETVGDFVAKIKRRYA
jgi:phosphohistidine swiveling domain-containing protein